MENLIIPRRDVKSGGQAEANKLSDRLRKIAPASLQLDSARCSLLPIPLLSPLILSPDPLPDCGVESRGDKAESVNVAEEKKSVEVLYGGSWHPALPLVAAMEPASLIPYFRAQCKMSHTYSSAYYDFV